MKLTHIIEEENGRKLTVNTLDWHGQESDEMQLTVMQHDDESFIDLSKTEARNLARKINEWLATNSDDSEVKIVVDSQHPRFKMLKFLLDWELTYNPCEHNYTNLKCAISKFEYINNCKVDLDKTIAFFQNKGGYCDCKIMMNVNIESS